MSENINSSDYIVIAKEDFPTKFRSYTHVKEIYTRGLYYSEANTLAKYIGTELVLYSQLAKLYENVIKFPEDSNLTIYDMEIGDFIIAMIISSIYTKKHFGWIPSVDCPHVIKNPEIGATIKDIEKLQNLPILSEEEQKELEELKKKLGILPEEVPCKGKVKELITLDDLDIETFVNLEVPKKVILQNGKIEKNIRPLTVRDLIILNEKDFSDIEKIDKNLMSYALLIDDKDISYKEKYNIVIKSLYGELIDLIEYNKRCELHINPIYKRCEYCRKEVKLKLGLMSLKAYP